MIRKALKGKTILITRPRRDADSLAGLVRSMGAEALFAPAIEILPPQDPAPLDSAIRLAINGGVEWTVFTSPRSVESVVARLVAMNLELYLPTRIAVVGEGTAESLIMLRKTPDLMPSEFTTKALAEAFPEGRGKVLLPRADIAPDGIEDVLRAKGWDPMRVTAYRTKFADSLPPAVLGVLESDLPAAVVFTSASTVQGFVRAGGSPRAHVKVVAIGPVAAEAAKAEGFTVDAVAQPHTIKGIAKALPRVFKGI